MSYTIVIENDKDTDFSNFTIDAKYKRAKNTT